MATNEHTVQSIQMCGYRLTVGDWVAVQYTTGTWSKGGKISGKITKLWNVNSSGTPFLQAEVENNWCFHDDDKILEHKSNEGVSGEDSGEPHTQGRELQ